MAKKHDDEDRVIIRFDNEEGEEEEAPFNLFDDEDETSQSKDPNRYADDSEEITAAGEKPVDEAEQMRLSFDRYGRRLPHKKKKSQYGKRKNAPKASTRIIQNDTIARREYEAAQERSRQRAQRRKAKEQSEKKRKERERRARRISILKTAGMATGVILILLVMTWYTTRIRTINVNHVPSGYTADEIVKRSGLETGVCIAFQNLDDAKKRIEEDAYLTATVKYSFPSTVTINIAQRTAAACVRWGPQNEYLAIIDSSAVVLNAESDTTEGLIVIDGLAVTTAQNGRALGDSTDMQVATLIRLLTKLEELDLMNRSPQISRIDMNEMMSISMKTSGSNYSIEVGDSSNLDTKLLLLQKHWSEIMNTAAQYISKGYSTATIYLYTKGGVSVSPYEPGYNYAMEQIGNYTLPTNGPDTTPNPIGTTEPTDPDATPPETPTPTPTVMPHQGGSFTG